LKFGKGISFSKAQESPLSTTVLLHHSITCLM